MKSIVAIGAVLAMVCASLAMAGVASAAGERNLTPVVEQGSTDRLGGGDWITVRAGDARVGVVYGTTVHPNELYVFAEYKRFLGGADVYDSRGNYLRTTGVPVYTVFGQSFDTLIEFQDRNNDSLLNLYRFDRNDTVIGDLPAKATSLVRAWTASTPTIEKSVNTTWVNFTVSTRNLPYDTVWGPLGFPRRGTPLDGVLERLAFTFHLKVDVREVSGVAPWYKVTLDDTVGRGVDRVEFLENRTFSGQAVAMGAKYDHLIEGWDFARPMNRLALETEAFLAHYLPQRVAEVIHEAMHSVAYNTTTFRRTDTDSTIPLDPTRLQGDVVYFDDQWEQVGRLVWMSGVTVDGQPDTMLFQVQGGRRFATSRTGAEYAGFAIRGAYIYPSGSVIEHDPGLEAVSYLWSLPEVLNLTPFLVLAIQVAVAAFAMGAAILLRARGRRTK